MITAFQPRAEEGTDMKRWIASFLGAVALLAPGLGRAAGWTPDLTVSSVFTEGATDIITVHTINGTVYATGCTANAWVFTFDTSVRASRAYATLLTAAATGKKVRLW
jgi:hypothetical protein